MLRLSVFLTTLCLMASTALAAETQTNSRIAAQPLAGALKEFAAQTGLQVVYGSELARGVTSQGAAAGLTIAQALKELLQGTGLGYEFLAERTVAIRAKSDSSAAASFNAASRLAQANEQTELLQPARGSEETAGQRASSSTKTNDEPAPQEVVVTATGTRIRGSNPTQPVQVHTRQDIERSGHTAIEQFMRTLTQDFRGGGNGTSEDGILGGGSSSRTNNEGGSAVNLRGLGENATLTLINGRRAAPAAFGRYVDISMIPLSAVERIDVLTDGASAIYGADAVGGVINIVLRKDYEGAETRLSYGGVTEGSMRTFNAGQTFGATWNGGNLVAGVQYKDRTALSTADRAFTRDTFQPTDISGDTTEYSGTLSFQHALTSRLQLFGDGLFSDRKLHRSYYVSATSYTVSNVDTSLGSLNLGLGFDAGRDWRLEMVGGFSRQKMQSANPAVLPVPNGYVLGAPRQRNEMDIANVEVQADGPLFELPGGPVRMAVGGSHRKEDIMTVTLYLPLSDTTRTRRPGRDVQAAFGELYIPVVGEGNRKAGIQRLDLSAAVRHDRYSDFGGTTNPKFGVLWSPVDQLDVRSSWGTSFRAPNMSELLNVGLFQSISNASRAAPGGTTARIFSLGGIDPNLGPEEADLWNVGLTYRPSFLQGASLSADYYNIRYKNRIIAGVFATDMLLRPEVYGSLLTSLADDAAAAAFLAAQIAQGRNFFNSGGFGSTGVRYVFDSQQRNAATVHQTGIDLTGRYQFEQGENRYDLGLSVSWIREILTGLTTTSVINDVVDTTGNPLSRRIRATAGWSRGAFQVNGSLNYRNDYTDISIIPNRIASSWTTADLNLRWNLDRGGGSLLRGVRVGLSALNVFDKDPPYVVSGAYFHTNIHYDAANADPYGRQLSLDITKQW